MNAFASPDRHSRRVSRVPGLDRGEASLTKPQELPKCHRHPDLFCPGECQYILGPLDCLNDWIIDRRE